MRPIVPAQFRACRGTVRRCGRHGRITPPWWIWFIPSLNDEKQHDYRRSHHPHEGEPILPTHPTIRPPSGVLLHHPPDADPGLFNRPPPSIRDRSRVAVQTARPSSVTCRGQPAISTGGSKDPKRSESAAATTGLMLQEVMRSLSDEHNEYQIIEVFKMPVPVRASNSGRTQPEVVPVVPEDVHR